MKKWIQRFIPLFLTLGVILLKTETTQAAEHSKNEANPDGSETLVIDLDDTFAPMGFRNEQGELVGFAIDLSALTCQQLPPHVSESSSRADVFLHT